MPSHPTNEDLHVWLTGTAELASSTPQDSPQYAEYHQNMNEVLDHLEREGGLK